MDGPRSAAEVELVVEALTHGDLGAIKPPPPKPDPDTTSEAPPTADGATEVDPGDAAVGGGAG